MSDLVERLRKPSDADRLYDWIIEKRKETTSDFPRLGFQNEMELIDEERQEAAARITELETSLAEAEGRVKDQIVNAIKTHQNFGDEDFGPGLDLAIDIATGEWRK